MGGNMNPSSMVANTAGTLIGTAFKPYNMMGEVSPVFKPASMMADVATNTASSGINPFSVSSFPKLGNLMEKQGNTLGSGLGMGNTGTSQRGAMNQFDLMSLFTQLLAK